MALPQDISHAAHHVSRPRGLWIAAGVFVLAYTILIMAAVAYFVSNLDRPSDRLYDYASPRNILSTRPDRDSPATLEQGMLLVRGYRCVRGEDTVVVQQFITYRAAEPPARTTSDPPAGQPAPERPRVPGCFEEDILLLLPAAVTPGFYYLEALERVPATGEFRTWFSEQFEVVAR